MNTMSESLNFQFRIRVKLWSVEPKSKLNFLNKNGSKKGHSDRGVAIK